MDFKRQMANIFGNKISKENQNKLYQKSKAFAP